MGKIVALDFGLKRIGAAVGDEDLGVAFPREPIAFTTLEASVREVVRLVDAERAEEIVVGYPTNLRGGETSQTRVTKEFVETLRQATHIPILSVDERLTTKVAQMKMKLQGLREKERRRLKDSISAALILEEWFRKK